MGTSTIWKNFDDSRCSILLEDEYKNSSSFETNILVCALPSEISLPQCRRHRGDFYFYIMSDSISASAPPAKPVKS